MKRFCSLICLLSGTFSLLFLLTACGTETPPEAGASASEQPLRVAAWTVEAKEISSSNHWSGTTKPTRIIALSAPRSGQITSLSVTEGQRVEARDILLYFAEPDIAARVNILAERVDQLEEEQERWESLAEVAAAGPAEVSQARLRVLEAREELNSLQAGQTPLLRAPSAGRVTALHTIGGAHVQAGQPLLEISLDAQMVELTLSAVEASRLQDMDLKVQTSDDQVFPVENLTLLESLTPGMVTARLYITNESERPFESVSITAEDTREVLLIPWTSLATEESEPWVGLITGDPPAVRRHPIELGKAYADGIEVVHGLEAGQIILRYDPRALAEGRIVEPVEAGQ